MSEVRVSKRWWRRTATATAAVVLTGSGVLAGGWLTTDHIARAEAEPPPPKDLTAVTEAQARAAAVKNGKPVEVLASRSERREVYANPDGTMTGVEHTQPVRTYRDGEWVSVDPTLHRRADGSVAPAATTVGMVFSGGGAGPLATVNKSGRSVSLGWRGRLPAPVLDGRTATYREVLPGVDLVIHAALDGFSHVLVVKNAKAAANPALARIEMPLRLDGVRVRESASGGVEVVDPAAGGVLIAADAPMMWDSSGGDAPGGEAANSSRKGARHAEVGVSVDADSLTLTPDPRLLKGRDTVYPVFIDPVWRDEYRSAWAMVDSGYPYEEYWKFDGAADEGLGRCPTPSGYCNNSVVKRLFYRVSTSFYKGRDIITAEFGVTLRHTWSGDDTSGDRVNLYKMSGGISTSTNWNNQPSGDYIEPAYPGAPSGGDCSYSSSYSTEWNVMPQVVNAAEKGTGSLTFGLRNATESDYTEWMRYCPNGHLRVKYNTPPSQPKMDDLGMTPGKGCSYDLNNDSYVNKAPKLTAFLFDADHGDVNEWGPHDNLKVSEQLKPQFRLVWGANDAYSWTSPEPDKVPDSNASGSKFELDLATTAGVPDLPAHEPIGWTVRAHDGVTFGPWSWTGSSTRCRFVIDPTAPDAPTVTSADFPDNDVWTEGVGEYGTFTFSSTSTDVAKYRYDFTGDLAGPKEVAAAADRTASVTHMPDQPGPHVLTVEALDLAENSSVNSYSFAVSVPPPVGSWSLADPVGSSQAADSAGSNPAAAGTGVTFGVEGRGTDTAASLDGGTGAHLTAPARGTVDTSQGFAASAWVSVGDLQRDQTVVSVNGLREPGFVLGYHAASRKWTFEIPDYDLQHFTRWRLTAGSSVEVGEWAHLLGVYDPGTRWMGLYVNGVLAAQATRHSTWSATGGVEIGRSYHDGRLTNHWSGTLAEVKVFDRVVFAEEAEMLATMVPSRVAYWQLNDAIESVSPEYDGSQGLTLAGDATIFKASDPDFGPFPLMGTGHLELHGIDGRATTATAVLDTSTSFSFTARVRLASAQPGTSMTVLSLPGANTDLMRLRYSVIDDAWQLLVAHSDSVIAEVTSVESAVPPSAEEAGQSLAVVYNALTDQVTLYVDGQAVTVAVPFTNAWPALGGLQVGRSVTGGEYFSGAIDDIRGYEGVLSSATVQRIGADNTEQPDL